MFKSCCGGSQGSVLEMEGKEKEENKPQEKAMKKKPEGYKLTYFKVRIGGEMIRLIFQKAKVPFEDNQIDEEQWPDMKPDTKWGKLPVLELPDSGTKIYSSTAIGRLLAKRFGLLGKDDVQAAKCDELVEVCQELRNVWNVFYFEKEQEKREENKINLINVLNTYLPKYNESVEENGNVWLVGDECTWADIFVANFLDVLEESVDKNILQSYPALLKMKAGVFDIPEIKAYVKIRPEASH